VPDYVGPDRSSCVARRRFAEPAGRFLPHASRCHEVLAVSVHEGAPGNETGMYSQTDDDLVPSLSIRERANPVPWESCPR